MIAGPIVAGGVAGTVAVVAGAPIVIVGAVAIGTGAVVGFMVFKLFN